jgi:hypothetical protein
LSSRLLAIAGVTLGEAAEARPIGVFRVSSPFGGDARGRLSA